MHLPGCADEVTTRRALALGQVVVVVNGKYKTPRSRTRSASELTTTTIVKSAAQRRTGGDQGRPAMANPSGGGGGAADSWEYSLRKYLLLLASLVATVTYGAGFNPPGGVWQTADSARHRIAGDPIIRETSYARYLVFFYSNATAFASSLVVVVLVLILSILHDRGGIHVGPLLAGLRVVMVLDLVSLMVAYAAGVFRDVLTAVYSLVLLTGVVVYLVVHLALASWPDKAAESAPPPPDSEGGSAPPPAPAPEKEERADDAAVARLRKVLMLLATFAVSVTYVAGLSAPGGFWDHEEDGHNPGEAILKGGPHGKRLKAFFVCNTTAFVASLFILVMLLEKKLCFSKRVRHVELYGFIAVTLLGLLAAYAAGASREIDTTIYVSALVGVVFVGILVQVVFVLLLEGDGEQSLAQQTSNEQQPQTGNVSGEQQQTRGPQTRNDDNASDEQQQQQTQGSQACNGNGQQHQQQQPQTQGLQASNGNGNGSDEEQQNRARALEKAHSLVLLLATLAAAITYQAGLNPPGGLWQSNDADGRYKNGDPILLTTNPRRYKAFYYCNSIAFVASLVAIVLVRIKTLHHHNALEAAMILDLFGLIGAYAAGSCRDVSTSIYAMALAGAVLVYVVIHVVFLTLDHKDGSSSRGHDDEAKEKKAAELLEKRRKRLLLFAILAATITYQAGLTPPGGFLLADDAMTSRHAGDPVLLNNYARRYTAFFYCNTVSFMLSIALIILLVNPNLYRPAIRSNALSVCTAAGMAAIMGAYAAGSTQHIKTSIYIFVLAAFVLCLVVVLVVVFWFHVGKSDRPAADVEMETGTENTNRAEESSDKRKKNKKVHAKRKYLMLLGILVAGITYQAGLAPPGGAWQANDGVHTAGNPVMHDNRRPRYLAFFYSNSVSFVASVVVIVLLLPQSLHEEPLWLKVMNATIVLDLLGLLIAYAAGSSRSWKTSVIVSALVLGVLGYFAIHLLLSWVSRKRKRANSGSAAHPNGMGNGGYQAQVVPTLELSEAAMNS